MGGQNIAFRFMLNVNCTALTMPSSPLPPFCLGFGIPCTFVVLTLSCNPFTLASSLTFSVSLQKRCTQREHVRKNGS